MHLQTLSKSINLSTRYWAQTKFRHQSRAITLLKLNEKYCSIIQIYILSISMHIQNLIEIHKLIHKLLSINKILTSNKGHDSVKNWPKITCIRHNMSLVFINAYTKFYQNSFIYSENIEDKHIYINQGPWLCCLWTNLAHLQSQTTPLWYQFEENRSKTTQVRVRKRHFTSIKDRNSVVYKRI